MPGPLEVAGHGVRLDLGVADVSVLERHQLTAAHEADRQAVSDRAREVHLVDCVRLLRKLLHGSHFYGLTKCPDFFRNFYHPQTKFCSKVIFSQASVCPRGGGLPDRDPLGQRPRLYSKEGTVRILLE